MMKLDLGFNLGHEVKVETNRLERHWNKKLSSPYPLAPKDLVRMGLVNPENYALENQALSSFRNSMMEKELTRLSSKTEFTNLDFPEIKVFGIGLARDLGWIEEAIRLGFFVSAYDVSSVACDLLSSVTEKLPRKRIQINTGEIEAWWARIEADANRTMVYHVAQFIQILKKTEMRRLMHRMMVLLDNRPLGIAPSLYVVHPFEKDNCGPRKWGGISFPYGVEWGDTIPYSEDELLDAMGKRKVKMDLLGVHPYFHQIYSFLKIQCG